MTKERKARRKADNAMIRSLIAELTMIVISGGDKTDRYLVAASACDKVGARLRERAAEA